MFLLQQGKKWSHPLQRFKADPYLTVLSWWQCKNSHYLHNEPCAYSYWAIQEHSSVCDLCKGGYYKCTCQCGDVWQSTCEASTERTCEIRKWAEVSWVSFLHYSHWGIEREGCTD
jgi:hypothetical protein